MVSALQPLLHRSMKAVGALLITLSAITPASAVFIIAPSVIQQAGTGALLSFLAAALVGICMAFVYAELAAAFPLTGGEYTIVSHVLGGHCGFIILGLNFTSFVLGFAALSLGCASYLEPLFALSKPITVAIIAALLATLCGVLAIRTNAMITGIFLAAEMAMLVVVAYLGFSHISHPLSEFILHPVRLDGSGNLVATSVSLIGLGTAVAIWAYNGYGQAVYLGEEITDAAKTIARVILWALMIAVASIAIPISAILLGSPDLKALMNSPTMLPDFIALHSNADIGHIISLGMALAIFNALIATVIMCSRQFFSSGRDKIWPQRVNNALTRIHPRFQSPWGAAIVFGTLGAAACFIKQDILFVMIGTAVVINYATLCVAVIVGRYKGTTNHTVYRMPLYPLPPIVGLMALIYVVYANFLDEVVGRPSLYATSGMIVAASVYYWLVLRKRGLTLV